MKVTQMFKLGAIAASILLTTSCTKSGSLLEGTGLSMNGLGSMTHFAGQMAGEMFTTSAPHDQVFLFGYDSSMVQPKYMDALQAQAKYLKSHPSAKVLLAGHTDERGSREYNVALGERRARSVAHVLRMSGVDRKQMRIVSYGKEKPVNLGHTDEARAQNRRVELSFESK